MNLKALRPALSAFLLMLTISMISTGLSFFVAPVCEDLGFGRGSFTLYYSLIVAAGAVSASFLGSWMNKKGVRGIIFLSAVWCSIGFVGFSLSGSLWMFWILGAAMGLLGNAHVGYGLRPVRHLYPGADRHAGGSGSVGGLYPGRV